MKFFCWNCRGLGNPKTVQELKKLLVATNLDVIFICETKLHSNSLSYVHNLCRMEGCLAVSSKGRSRGLELMWKDEVVFQNYSNHHIDSLVSMGENKKIHFTGFYGHTDPNLRKRSWEILRRVGVRSGKVRWWGRFKCYHKRCRKGVG
ncbi:hypothetical protein CXB51_024366 [Gossypium anomalum]|uniref:Endonuclease/exonuclease/phosphatase domain-containing protein n=1 Tax=Gossypium anomalum TaxID=47600 RepID=A0A8J6CPD0_9ROSI|nr:hypothetical protein CXB51_024366 [Gossypium anomalum]